MDKSLAESLGEQFIGEFYLGELLSCVRFVLTPTHGEKLFRSR